MACLSHCETLLDVSIATGNFLTSVVVHNSHHLGLVASSTNAVAHSLAGIAQITFAGQA